MSWQDAVNRKYGGKRQQTQNAQSGGQTLERLVGTQKQTAAPMSTQTALELLYDRNMAAQEEARRQQAARYSLNAAPQMVEFTDPFTAAGRRVTPEGAFQAGWGGGGSRDVRAQTLKTVGSAWAQAMGGLPEGALLPSQAQKDAMARGLEGIMGEKARGEKAIAQARALLAKEKADAARGAVSRFEAAHPNGRMEIGGPLANAYREASMALSDYQGTDEEQNEDRDERIGRLFDWLGNFSHPEELLDYYGEGGVNEITGNRESQRAEADYLQAILDRMEAERTPEAQPETPRPLDDRDLGSGWRLVNGTPLFGQDYNNYLWEHGPGGAQARADAANAAKSKAISDAVTAEQQAREALVAAWDTASQSERTRLQQNLNDAVAALQAERQRLYDRGLSEAQAQEAQVPGLMMDYYRSLQYNPDFEELSREDETGEPERITRFRSGTQMRALGVDDAMEQEREREAVMTETEKATARYLRRKEGDAAAEEYLNALAPELDARVMQGAREQAQAFGAEHPVLGSVASILGNVEGGIEGSRYVLGRVGDVLGSYLFRQSGREQLNFDPNNPAFRAGVTRDALRAGVTENMGPVGKFLYNSLMSGVADSTVNMLAFGGAGEVMMGLGAMADTVRQTKERGGNDAQALFLGAVSGAAEIVTEHLSFDRVRGLFGRGKAPAAELIRDALGNSISEFGEEATSEIVNIVADVIARGDESEFTHLVNGYTAQGMDERQATWRALADMAAQVGEAGLGGAVGGVVMGGGSAAMGQAFDAVARASAKNDVRKMSEGYGNAAGAFVNNYKGNMLPAAYKAVFDALFGAGQDGQTLEEATENLREAAPELAETMDQASVYGIWQAGANQAAETAGANAEAEKREAAGLDADNLLLNKDLRRTEREEARQAREAAREEARVAEARDLEAGAEEMENEIGMRNQMADREAKRAQQAAAREQARVEAAQEQAEGAQVVAEDIDARNTLAAKEARRAQQAAAREQERIAEAREQAEGAQAVAEDIDARNTLAAKEARRAQQAAARIAEEEARAAEAQNPSVASGDSSPSQGSQVDRGEAELAEQVDRRNMLAIRQTAKQRQAEARWAKQTAQERQAAVYDRDVTPGVVRHFDTHRQLSHKVQMQMLQLDEFGKALGMEFDVSDSIAGGKANGAYAGGKRFMVALDAMDGAILQAGVHEVVHYIAATDRRAYEALESVVFENLVGASEGEYNVDEEVRRRMDAYRDAGKDLTEAESKEEIVSEAVPTIFSDAKATEAFVSEHRDIAYKIRDFFIRLADKIRQIAYKYARDSGHKEINYLLDESDRLTEIARTFDAALEAAGETAQAREVAFGEAEAAQEQAASVKGENEQTRAYSYDELTTKPDMEIPIIEVGEYFDKDETTKAGHGNVLKYSDRKDSRGAPMMYVDDLGKYVTVGEKAMKHRLQRDTPQQAPVIMHIGDILKNSIVINEATPKKENMRNSWILLGAALTKEGRLVLVRSIINQSTAQLEDVTSFYAAYGKETGTTHSMTAATEWQNAELGPYGSTISITELLDNVKGLFDDVISEDVAEHLGITRSTSEFTDRLKYSAKTNVNTEAFRRWFGDSKVVDKDGRPLVVYHGTDERFTVFDMDKARTTMDIQGAFFSPDKLDAGGYGGKVGAYYLSIQNPAPFNVAYAALQRFKGQDEAGKKAREYLISKGYDGVNNEGEEYIAFYPEQIKSATDNVGTYDRRNPDIRFSLNNTSEHEVDTARVLEGVDGRPPIRITNENPSVAFGDSSPSQGSQAAEASQEQAKTSQQLGNTRDGERYARQRQAAMDLANVILRDYKSQYSKDFLRENLAALYDELAKNGQSDDTLAAAAKLARAIIEQSRAIDNTWAEQYADLKRRLREIPITLTEQQRQEAANIAGSYGAYRQSMFGTLNLVREGGTPLDSLWEELSGQHPELFPPDTQEGDMMKRLAEIKQELQPHYSNPYGMDLDAAATDLAMQMHERLLGLLGNTNEAQAMRAGMEELRRQWREAMDEELILHRRARRKAFDEIARALRNAREKGDELAAARAMKEYRAELMRVQADQAEAEAALSYRQHYEDRDARAQAMKHITQTVERLTKMLARPDKSKHIPTAMQPFVHGLLEGVTGKMRDTQKTRQFAANLSGLRDYLAKQLDMQQGLRYWDDEHAGSWMALTEDMISQLDQSIYTVQNADRPLFTMTLKQLQTFSKALQNIHHAIVTNNQMWTDARHESMDKVGGDTIDELTGKRTNMAQADEKSVRAVVDRFLNLDQLDARSFFARLGKNALKIYDALQTGQSRVYARVREASEAVPAILGIDGKDRRRRVNEWRQWANDMHEFTVPGIDRNGPREDTLKLTTRELMELYALSRRAQGRQHILTGGIQIGDSKRGADRRTYKFDEAMLDSIVNTLTPEQKRFVERMQEYLSHTVSEWGNEVTEQMYLYRMFGEDNYWPIQSSRDFLATKDRDGQFMFNALVNMGFTKNLQEMARNPVVIRDAVETFAGHISEMATFSGMAMPMDDLLRWYNYAAKDENGRVAYTDSVKGQIARTMGNAGRKYVQNLIDNINGMGDSAMVSDVAQGLMGKYKRAAILANLRVVVQQPTAILRASAMMNPAYLTAAARHGAGKNTIREMQEHSALAWWKGNGNYEIGTGQSMMSTITGMEEDLWGDVENKLGALAGKADDLGWAIIWQAVKAETRARHKNLDVGSAEYWQTVVERFEDVCMQTQVVDTVLTRSQAMRSKDWYMKMITAFMAEPTKNYNLIRTAIGDWYDAMNRKDVTARHRAEGMIVRSALAIAAATAANAVMTAAFDATRYYNPDEEDEWGEKIGAGAAWWNKFWDNFKGDLISGLNPLENIPLVKDAWQLVNGQDVERMDMSMLSKLIKAISRVEKYYFEGNKNGYTQWAAVKPLITSLGDILGVPMSSLVKDVETLLHPFEPGINATYRRSKTVSGATQELYDAMVSGDAKQAAALRAEMKAGQNGRDPLSDKQIDEKLSDALALNDERIGQMWQMRHSGRTSGILALKRAVIADGWTDEQVTRAVNRYDDVVKSGAKKLYLQAMEAGDDERAKRYAEQLRGVGVTDEDIAKWTAEKDTDEQMKMEAMYTKENLAAAIRNGQATDAEIMDMRDYIASQSTAKDPLSGIRSSLTSEFKDEYIAMVKAGDTKGAERLRARLIAAGASAKTIDEWAPKEAKDAVRDALVDAIDSGDAKRAEAEIERMRDEEIMDVSALVTRLNNEYKQRYIDLMSAGKEREAEALADMLAGLGLRKKNGENYYRMSVFREWLNKWEKEQEQEDD